MRKAFKSYILKMIKINFKSQLQPFLLYPKFLLFALLLLPSTKESLQWRLSSVSANAATDLAIKHESIRLALVVQEACPHRPSTPARVPSSGKRDLFYFSHNLHLSSDLVSSVISPSRH